MSDLVESFNRTSIGFASILEFVRHADCSYPKYNLYCLEHEYYCDDGRKELHYQLEIAVAGYKPSDINVSWTPDYLLIESKSQDSTTNKEMDAIQAKSYGMSPLSVEERKILHRGIARRAFALRFALRNVEVEKATFDNGLLVIELIRRVVPLQMSVRIPISVINGQRRTYVDYVEKAKEQQKSDEKNDHARVGNIDDYEQQKAKMF